MQYAGHDETSGCIPIAQQTKHYEVHVKRETVKEMLAPLVEQLRRECSMTTLHTSCGADLEKKLVIRWEHLIS